MAVGSSARLAHVRCRLALAALAAAVALVLAACAGGGESTAGETSQAETSTGLAEDADAAGVLRLFVEAAGRGDAEGMWGLLSERSRERLGPTLDDFARRYAEGFQEGLGSFAGTPYEVVLSDVTPSGWGIAAIAGDRTRAGKREYATYAAALTRQRRGWRLVLGDPVAVELLSPRGQTKEKQPQVRFRVRADAPVEEAGLWLDGAPVPATAGGSGRNVLIAGTPPRLLAPGRHVIVLFGRSGDDATAGASVFVVQGGTTA